jgi:hypothetical protein
MMAHISDREQTVVLRWRTKIACEALGPTLDRAFPTEHGDGFAEAIKAIDEAESAVWADRKPADDLPE